MPENTNKTQDPLYTKSQMALLKNTIAKGATDDELKVLIDIAQKYGLDPFIKEIWFIKHPQKVRTPGNTWDYPRLPNGDIDYSDAETLIMTSRDGYLKIAQRDEDFNGILGFVVREGDTFEIDAELYKVTHKFGVKRGPILGAWAKVDHKKRKAVIVYADFREYYVESSFTWRTYPSAMILKVAEVLALKRQFGISGLVTKEEMIQEEPDEEIHMEKVEVTQKNKTNEGEDTIKPNEVVAKRKTKEDKNASDNKPATDSQRKMVYAKSKEAGLNIEDYKTFCERLHEEGKLSSVFSKDWKISDIQVLNDGLMDFEQNMYP